LRTPEGGHGAEVIVCAPCRAGKLPQCRARSTSSAQQRTRGPEKSTPPSCRDATRGTDSLRGRGTRARARRASIYRDRQSDLPARASAARVRPLRSPPAHWALAHLHLGVECATEVYRYHARPSSDALIDPLDQISGQWKRPGGASRPNAVVNLFDRSCKRKSNPPRSILLQYQK
jgi:hypothetical protein